MVFINQTREKENRPHVYQAFITWIKGNAYRPRSSCATYPVRLKERRRCLNIFQPRCAIAIVMMGLIGFIGSANAEMRYYKVRSGDTLSLIAKMHGVSYRQLACLNDIADPNLISIGQRIELPQPHGKTHLLNLQWPIDQGRLTSHFGLRGNACHQGIDIAAPRGTAVRAADAGKVVFSGRQNGYGKMVILRHAKGHHTLYAHLQRLYVKGKQKVRRGQRIAKVGSSGRSTGPHLHFEVRVNGRMLDPMSFLPQKTRIVLNPKSSSAAARGGK